MAEDNPTITLPAVAQVQTAYENVRQRAVGLGIARDIGFRMPTLWIAEGHSTVADVWLYRSITPHLSCGCSASGRRTRPSCRTCGATSRADRRIRRSGWAVDEQPRRLGADAGALDGLRSRTPALIPRRRRTRLRGHLFRRRNGQQPTDSRDRAAGHPRRRPRCTAASSLGRRGARLPLSAPQDRSRGSIPLPFFTSRQYGGRIAVESSRPTGLRSPPTWPGPGGPSRSPRPEGDRRRLGLAPRSCLTERGPQ